VGTPVRGSRCAGITLRYTGHRRYADIANVQEAAWGRPVSEEGFPHASPPFIARASPTILTVPTRSFLWACAEAMPRSPVHCGRWPDPPARTTLVSPETWDRSRRRPASRTSIGSPLVRARRSTPAIRDLPGRADPFPPVLGMWHRARTHRPPDGRHRRGHSHHQRGCPTCRGRHVRHSTSGRCGVTRASGGKIIVPGGQPRPNLSSTPR